jgi:hypothetical protein
MVNKVGNCYSVFTLTIACFVDRYAEAITRLPNVFKIRILLDGANDSFAPDAHPGVTSPSFCTTAGERVYMTPRRYSLGATPKTRLKALLNAASES